MNEQHWIPIFIQQSESVMTLWTAFIIVNIGVVGFVIQRGAAFTLQERILFVGAFILFAIANGIPLYEAQQTLVEIKQALAEIKPKIPSSVEFRAHNPKAVIAIHILFDLIIVSLLIGWPFKKFVIDTNKKDQNRPA